MGYPHSHFYHYLTRTVANSITNLVSSPELQALENSKVGKITAHSFVVSKTIWTFTIGSSTISAPKNITRVSQRAKLDNGGTSTKRATGVLHTTLSGSGITSVVVTADAGSLPFNTMYDLVIGETTILSTFVTSVSASGGRCRCAEKPNSSSGKLQDGYWSYYFDRSVVRQHPIRVGDELELSIDSGTIHGAKTAVVEVTTVDKFYFNITNPQDLCVQTVFEWYNKYAAMEQTTVATFAPPMSNWRIQSFSSGTQNAFIHYFNSPEPSEKYPELFKNTDFQDKFNTWLTSQNKNTFSETMKESLGFNYCIALAKYVTVRRLSGSADVWYKKDPVDPREATRYETKEVIPDVVSANDAREKSFYYNV
tara:strand:+ start:47 stop:1144 length:1098 start_codon:yes stop_codon:yes gene_type:complete